jgi:hypothetical protein
MLISNSFAHNFLYDILVHNITIALAFKYIYIYTHTYTHTRASIVFLLPQFLVPCQTCSIYNSIS